MSSNQPTGGHARTFCSAFRGKAVSEILQILDADAAAGQCTRAAGTSGGKPMIRYLYPDATHVRVLPEGTSLRPDPLYIIEIVKRPGVCATLEDVAFKVDGDARPVPKGPADMNFPSKYLKHRNPFQYAAYRDAIMEYGYQLAKR